MKNFYATVLVTTALVLCGTADAQNPLTSKNSSLIRGNRLVNESAFPHHNSGNELRGGGTPVNDACSSATTVSLAAGSSVIFTGDNTNATADGDFEPGSGLETFGPVVWHKFSTSVCTNLTVSYCATSPGFGNVAAFLANTCPATDADYVLYSSGDFTTCAAGDNATLHFNNLAAGEYYFPVLMDTAVAVGPYSIELSAVACPTPPGNDDCAGAISVTSSTSCFPSVAFTTNGATQSMPAILCNGYTSPNANDVWFSFVCTNAEQTIGVVGYNAADAVVELFSGSCGSLTSLGCADNTFPTTATESSTEMLDQTGLTVGSTYYVRVYDYAHGSAAHNFEICVTEGAGSSIGIAEVENNGALTIFPNPGSGQFNIRYAGEAGLGTIEVFDLTGRSVYSEQAQMVPGAVQPLKLGKLAAGQYNVRLTVNGVRSVESLKVQ